MSRKKKILLIVVAVVVIGVVAAVVALTNQKGSTPTQGNNSQNADQKLDQSLLGERFTNVEAGVTMQVPKGWKLAPRNEESESSLTKFVQDRPSGKGVANGELQARQTNVHIDDIVRGYLEAAMDIHATPNLASNQDEVIGNRVVRVVAQEMPGPDGVVGRLQQYIIYNNDRKAYYVISYALLASDYEAERPALEESVKSLQISAK